jgi:carbon-monoxide dehydrogenase medium subunit
MIRTRLTHHAPTEIADACALLAEHGEDAAVVGGGTMLVPQMVRGERTVHHAVDLRRLGLHRIALRDGEVAVGAMATYTDVAASAELAEHAALLPIAAAGITGGAQIRNQGTIGGSACYANPASDVPAVLVALRARMQVHGPDGTREVAAEAFFVDAFSSALRRGELLAAVVIPAQTGRVGYEKIKLSESSWPIATAAAVVGDGAEPAVTLGGVARTPLRLDVGALVDGDGTLGDADALEALVRERLTEPWEDELAPGSYRRDIAGAVARRSLIKAKEERA